MTRLKEYSNYLFVYCVCCVALVVYIFIIYILTISDITSGYSDGSWSYGVVRAGTIIYAIIGSARMVI